MNDFDERYPDWLYRDLFEGSLPWQDGHVLTIEQFHEIYTLHDSYWIGINYGPHLGAMTVCVKWDPYWLPGDIAPKTPIVANWPFLFIRITGVTEISFDRSRLHERFGAGPISDCEFIEVDGKQVITLNDDAGSILITYVGGVRFLALDRNREVLSLHTL